MRIGSLLSLGAIVAVAVLGSAYLDFGVVNRDAFADHTTALMDLPDAGGLGEGSAVLLTGVRIGTVAAVDTAPAGVRVRLRLDAEHRVPLDSRVVIENLSVLGEPYVEIVPRTADGPYLADGQAIPPDRVRPAISIARMARMAAELLRQLRPDAVGRLIDTVVTAYAGNAAVVPDLARSTDLLAALIGDRSAALGRTITALQSIAPDMDWTGPAMTTASPPFIEFGQRVDAIADAVGRLFTTGDSPRMYLEGNGLVPFLDKLTARIDAIGPDLAPLAPMLVPLRDIAVRAFPRIDLSALISQVLLGLDEDAVHVRVGVR
ncbi:MlaD family protein [Nocardia sp. NPDC004068]|uniref:MlaD family protein n=1 Tax=Nocardia sp. NPDC004068 TaxID=3364303 RepID=UPI0036B456D2